MNIVQIIPHYVPAYEFGGPLRVAHGLSKALLDQGHAVKICTTNLKSGSETLDLPIDVPVFQDGIEVYYEPTVFSHYWGFSPQLYRRVSSLINSADVVFIHFHYQFANWAGASIARKLGKPYVIFAHGSLNQWGIAHKSQRKKKLYLRFFEQANLEKALFIAFNAVEEQELSLFADHGVVISSGVNPDEFKSTSPQGSWRSRHRQLINKTCILYLGRLNSAQKGLDMLLPAFAQLRQQREDVHLILAGPDERGGEAEVRELVAILGIVADVTFTGMVDGPEKLAILRDSDIYALVSPSEGLSIALLEALYMGLPVVVTNRVGLSAEIEREKAGIVVERDIEQIAAALLAMVDNAAQRRQMGAKAHQLVAEKYTWDAIAATLIEEVRARINP